MSLPRKYAAKIKRLFKQYGIEVQVLNNDLDEFVLSFLLLNSKKD